MSTQLLYLHFRVRVGARVRLRVGIRGEIGGLDWIRVKANVRLIELGFWVTHGSVKSANFPAPTGQDVFLMRRFHKCK